MTEEEAKQKWCPFARAKGCGDEGSWNRGRYDKLMSYDPHCIGSECMAWRAIVREVEIEGGRYLLDENNKTSHGPTSGYCGLAGKP